MRTSSNCCLVTTAAVIGGVVAYIPSQFICGLVNIGAKLLTAGAFAISGAPGSMERLDRLNNSYDREYMHCIGEFALKGAAFGAVAMGIALLALSRFQRPPHA